MSFQNISAEQVIKNLISQHQAQMAELEEKYYALQESHEYLESYSSTLETRLKKVEEAKELLVKALNSYE